MKVAANMSTSVLNKERLRQRVVSHQPLGATAAGLSYGLLFIPYVLAWLTASVPMLSYGLSWTGSWWILALTLKGYIKPLPGGIREQLLRPIGFTHLAFAAYTALTSVFHVIDINGVYSFGQFYTQVIYRDYFSKIAEAQRYYVLLHGAFATGALVFMDYRRSGEWQIRRRVPLPSWMLSVSIATFAGAIALTMVPGVEQVATRLRALSLVSSVLAVALALPLKKGGTLLLSGFVYAANVFQAVLSGWKEEIIVMFLLLAVFAYPYYRRTVLLTAPIVVGAILLILPAYNEIFRELSWREGMDSRSAAAIALSEVRNARVENLKMTSWAFMSGRLSEIELFVRYLRVVPERRPFWGMQIVEQSLQALVPRALWPDKPNTELLAMERVYQNEIVNRASEVSSKPQYVVDGYLSAGAFGVLISGLVYGMLASLASRLAERWFGGYMVGTGLVYMSQFQIMWRGNCFEFLFGTVLWSFVLMWVLFMSGRMIGLITRRQNNAA